MSRLARICVPNRRLAQGRRQARHHCYCTDQLYRPQTRCLHGPTCVSLTFETSGVTLQAVFTLDLVAMMAGGSFQGVANTFVEAMEANALAKTAAATEAASGASTAEQPCPGSRPCAGETTTAVHTAPPPKKAKRDQPAAATGKPGSDGGIRRIEMPPLDVFQRDYMETATPVILTGVS